MINSNPPKDLAPCINWDAPQLDTKFNHYLLMDRVTINDALIQPLNVEWRIRKIYLKVIFD